MNEQLSRAVQEVYQMSRGEVTSELSAFIVTCAQVREECPDPSDIPKPLFDFLMRYTENLAIAYSLIY